MSSNKYFRFFCKAVPSKYLIDESKPAASQKIYTETSKDELEQFNVVGMPIFLNHVNGIKVEEVNGSKVYEYPKNRHILGYVVKKMIGDDGSLLTLVEIPPVNADLLSTDEGRQADLLKKSAIKLIEGGTHNKVSFTHGFDRRYDKDYDADIIKKYPLELSITNKPLREGSSILTSYYSDEPYVLDDPEAVRNFNAMESLAMSAVDKAAEERNKNNLIQESSQKQNVYVINNSNSEFQKMQNNNQQQQQQQQQASSSSSNQNPEMAKLLQEMEQLRNENNKLKPVAEQFHQEKLRKTEEQKKNFIDNTDSISKAAEFLLKSLLEADKQHSIIDPADKAIFERLSAELPESNKDMPQKMSELLMTEERSKIEPAKIESGQVFENFDRMMANLSRNIVACSEGAKVVNKLVEANNKLRSELERHTSKNQLVNSNIAAEKQQQQKSTREPEFASWNGFKERFAKQEQSMLASDADVQRLKQTSNSNNSRAQY